MDLAVGYPVDTDSSASSYSLQCVMKMEVM